MKLFNYLHLTKFDTVQNYFDMSRLCVGFGYRFSSKLRSEIGVMNQMTNSISRKQLDVLTFFNF
jgi:hypothetical protein